MCHSFIVGGAIFLEQNIITGQVVREPEFETVRIQAGRRQTEQGVHCA